MHELEKIAEELAATAVAARAARVEKRAEIPAWLTSAVKSNPATHGLIGAGVGAGLGGLAGAFGEAPENGRKRRVLSSALTGGLAGGALGAGIGLGRDAWAGMAKKDTGGGQPAADPRTVPIVGPDGQTVHVTPADAEKYNAATAPPVPSAGGAAAGLTGTALQGLNNHLHSSVRRLGGLIRRGKDLPGVGRFAEPAAAGLEQGAARALPPDDAEPGWADKNIPITSRLLPAIGAADALTHTPMLNTGRFGFGRITPEMMRGTRAEDLYHAGADKAPAWLREALKDNKQFGPDLVANAKAFAGGNPGDSLREALTRRLKNRGWGMYNPEEVLFSKPAVPAQPVTEAYTKPPQPTTAWHDAAHQAWQAHHANKYRASPTTPPYKVPPPGTPFSFPPGEEIPKGFVEGLDAVHPREGVPGRRETGATTPAEPAQRYTRADWRQQARAGAAAEGHTSYMRAGPLAWGRPGWKTQTLGRAGGYGLPLLAEWLYNNYSQSNADAAARDAQGRAIYAGGRKQ